MTDLGKAFGFMFKDREWFVKFLVAAVFMVLSVLIVGIFIVAGYLIQVTQRVMRREEEPLPPWTDIGAKLVLGFKFCVVYLVYSLPIIFVYIPYIIITVFSALQGSGELAGVFAGMQVVSFGLLFLFVIPYSLLLAAFLPVIVFRFARRETIGDALDIKEVFRDFKGNWQNTLIVALISIGIQYFAGVGIILLIVGVLFTVFYAYLVSAYLYGLLGREISGEGTTV